MAGLRQGFFHPILNGFHIRAAFPGQLGQHLVAQRLGQRQVKFTLARPAAAMARTILRRLNTARLPSRLRTDCTARPPEKVMMGGIITLHIVFIDWLNSAFCVCLMAIKPRAHCGQIAAGQSRQRRVHGVRGLLLLVNRAIAAMTFADGQFAEHTC